MSEKRSWQRRFGLFSAFEDPDILMGLAVRNLNSHGGSSQLALAAFVGDGNGLQELEP